MISPCNGGYPAAANAAKLILLAVVIFMSCNKPVKTIQATVKDTAVGVTNTAKPTKVKKKHKKKKLYLTFDDGPNKGTQNVLRIVQDEKIPVTFFVIGEHVFASAYQQQVWDSLQIAEHIELCNHSYSHAHHQYLKYYEDATAVVNDFKRTRDSLGLTNNIARTPGRNIWRTDSLHFTDLKRSAAAGDSLQQAGFVVLGWDLEWKFDSKTMSVTASASKMLDEIDSTFAQNKTMQADNLVLLAHDQVYTKSDDSMQLRHFLQTLKKRDQYEISLVTSYPGAGKYVQGLDSIK